MRRRALLFLGGGLCCAVFARAVVDLLEQLDLLNIVVNGRQHQGGEPIYNVIALASVMIFFLAETLVCLARVRQKLINIKRLRKEKPSQ